MSHVSFNRVKTRVALLLAGSGFSALIYETVWLRELRLIFGSSTAATAAVSLIFMAGLGFGGMILGSRVEKRGLGIRFYGQLELAIAALAAVSPVIAFVVAKIYFATGGSFASGQFVATLLRLLCATLTLGAPAFLMGGTLPAAARGVEKQSSRADTALLYGANTLGAVAGTLVSTFYLLERLGNRGTLFAGVAVNVVVGLIALKVEDSRPRLSTSTDGQPRAAVLHLYFAAVAGFVFLLMEIVWYRMLTPLIGGSTFTYGLILAMALLGIGIGGLLYAFRPGATLAFTAALEALALAIPIALGDRIAIVAGVLRSHEPLVGGWILICVIVVLPAAIISGYQFPLLIAMAGKGREGLAADVGRVYAWNTAGAIAGSLAGGFGLLPLAGATGAWKIAIVATIVLSIAAGARRTIAVLAAAAALAFATLGPTAAWRASPIGVGRLKLGGVSKNDIEDWLRAMRRDVLWQRDGVESHIAVLHRDGYSLLVNGKPDGHAISDAGTQIMAPLVGPLLQPHPPRTALVIGLGTGSSAGWLGSIPSMQRVDAVELEPAVIEFAKLCGPANREVLRNPRVHVAIGDAREFLLTTRNRYDVIFSEPSNPWRAGIASLFTREYYRAAADRLGDDGVFLQWVQLYEIDEATLRTIIATMRSVLPHVQVWSTMESDLLLVGSRGPLTIDAAALRRRIEEDPYRLAIHSGWKAYEAEDVLAHFVGGEKFTAAMTAPVNTDDRNRVEFGFARTLGVTTPIDGNAVRLVARKLGDDFPPVAAGVDASHIAAARILNPTIGAQCDALSIDVEQLACRVLGAIRQRQFPVATELLATRPTLSTDEYLLLVFSEAQTGDERARILGPRFTRGRPVEAAIVAARFALMKNDFDQAYAAMRFAIDGVRRAPLIHPTLANDLFACIAELAARDATLQRTTALFGELREPFALDAYRDRRLDTMLIMAEHIAPCGGEMLSLLHEFEPWTPWNARFLGKRAECYAAVHDPLEARAAQDLARFNAAAK
jgi:spermidine synthase